ncbi:Kinase [Hexamita inflata]|uniref:non-specific serine/threonine protein kinase n=1 Tax=Hexamita inflata TaxID=28002 RepID=A0AA86RDL6_9EUKA|nr:AGC PDK1 [Hexamita inflata]
MQPVIEEEDKLQKYQFTDLLGNGAYGQVYRAICTKDSLAGKQVAIKVIEGSKLVTKQDCQTLERETKVFKEITNFVSENSRNDNFHCYLLRCYSVFQQKSKNQFKKYFILQLASTDLEKIIHSFSPLPFNVIQHLLAQIVLSLQQLHSLGFVHRDVKPSNFLLDRDGNILLADFGTAKQFDIEEYRLIQNGYSAKISIPEQSAQLTITPPPPREDTTRARNQSMVGTISYAAPEVISGKGIYSAPLDIWGLGCIAFELATGLPFVMTIDHSIKQKQSQLERVKKIRNEALQQFIFRCLKTEPRARFDGGWEALRGSKLFQGYDFEHSSQVRLIRMMDTLDIIGQKLVSQQIPLISIQEQDMMVKAQAYLLQSELVLFGQECDCRFEERQFKALIIVTDFKRLLLINMVLHIIELEHVITISNTRFNHVQSDYSIIQLQLQPFQHVLQATQQNNVIIQAKLSQQFSDQFKTHLKREGTSLCPQCNNNELVDDICYKCGFQLPFIQKQTKQLKIEPRYFPKKEENEQLYKWFQLQNDQCDISVYLQRKNRLYLSPEQIFDQSLEYTIDPVSKPNLIKLTKEQHLLRQLTAKIYWFSKRWLYGDITPALPRVNALYLENHKFSEATLNFIEMLANGCIKNQFEIFRYYYFEEKAQKTEKKVSDEEVQLFGTVCQVELLDI